MQFIELVTIDPENGKKVTMHVNPEEICFIAPAITRRDIAGPDGEMMGREVAVLSFGMQSLIVDYTIEEVLQKLQVSASPLRIVKFPKQPLQLQDNQDLPQLGPDLEKS